MIFIIIIYHRTSANFILVPLVIINDSRKDKSYRFSFLFLFITVWVDSMKQKGIFLLSVFFIGQQTPVYIRQAKSNYKFSLDDFTLLRCDILKTHKTVENKNTKRLQQKIGIFTILLCSEFLL